MPRVYELAKEFHTDSKTLLRLLVAHGVEAKNPFFSVGDEEQKYLQSIFAKERQSAFEEKEEARKVREDAFAAEHPQIFNHPEKVKVSSLTIYTFRKFLPDMKIPLHPNITFIVGQNATSKSTLLGMICQPLEFTSKYKKYTRIYDNIAKQDIKTIAGAHFESEFSNVFRMSPIYDNPENKKYTYDIHLTVDDDTLILPVSSERRGDQKKNNIRFVAGSTRHSGDGNFPHPVIYLGLKRLYPLADSEKFSVNPYFELSKEEKDFYAEWQQKIMVVPEKIEPEFVSTDTRDFLGAQTSIYDAETNSAGQDNLGQLLSAIISFMRLKETLQERYCGGVLLIDEVDATFHILAQEKLLELFVYASQHLNLQIVCTTHSLGMIQLCNYHYKRYASIVLLYRRGETIRANSDVSCQEVEAEIKAAAVKDYEPPLTTVLFEDNVATQFFRFVTNGQYAKLIKTYSTEQNNDRTALSADVYLRLAARDIPEFNAMIFVIDGDKRGEISRKHHHILALPGTRALEKEMYQFLYTLPEDDAFWSLEPGGYNWQMCFRDYVSIPDNAETKIYKEWFAQQKNYWGQGMKKLYIRWMQANKTAVLQFNQDFFKIYNQTSKTKIGDAVLQRITAWIESV